MWIHILVFFTTFCFMEFMAWFSHKYIMHGFLWSLHADHHKKDHDSWFERNDAFFIFYAIVSIGCFLLWKYDIFIYGFARIHRYFTGMNETLVKSEKATVEWLRRGIVYGCAVALIAAGAALPTLGL